MTMKTESALKPVAELEETPDDFDFELSHFAEAEAGQAWLVSLPCEEAEVDERLKKRVTVTMHLLAGIALSSLVDRVFERLAGVLAGLRRR